MKLLTLIGITLLLSTAPLNNTEDIETNLVSVNETEVYVCTGPSSKKYHYSNSCRGLSRCSKSIVKVKLSKAKEMGRTLCGWED